MVRTAVSLLLRAAAIASWFVAGPAKTSKATKITGSNFDYSTSVSVLRRPTGENCSLFRQIRGLLAESGSRAVRPITRSCARMLQTACR